MIPAVANLRVNSKDELDTEAFPAPSLTPSTAQHIVNRGSVAFSVMVTTGRVADLMVNLNGISSISTYGQLRNLIGDSWIMTSSALVPYTGKIDIPTAIIRAAVMLIAKRIWKIQQLAPVKEAIVLMHFAALAGKLLRDQNQPLSNTLLEISAVPIVVYTSIAEVIRNTATRLHDALCVQMLQEIYTPVPSSLPTYTNIERAWRRSIPVQTRELHRRRAPQNPRDTLLEWQHSLFTPHASSSHLPP